jgi:hypothetical protein
VSVSAAKAFVHARAQRAQDELIIKAGRSVADAVAKANAAIKAKADRAAAAKEQQARQPRLGEFKRTDGQVKSACDYNPEDPGDVAESDADTPEIIRHRIFLHHLDEALRHAREVEKLRHEASAQEITRDIITGSAQAADEWLDLASKLQRQGRGR